MRFFVPKPFAADMNQARQAHECMRSFAGQTLGLDVTDRKVYQIEFVDEGERQEACVGEPEPRSLETVVAILDAPRKYLVCTPNHGGYQGEPIVVGKQQTKSVIEFEE